MAQLTETPGAFISGVGTGGTLIGIAKRLKENYKDVKIIALEPDKMPMISKGKVYGHHKIEGIGDDFIPDLFNKKLVDDFVLVNDDDAINMSRKLARELGLGVGISSGANFIGSAIKQNEIEKPIVTIFADDNKKYLSTDLSKEIDENKDFLSNKIELLDFSVV